MGSGDTWALNVTYAYTDSLTVSLMDNDGTSGNDPLGSFTFVAGTSYTSPVPVSDPNGAEYQISFNLAGC